MAKATFIRRNDFVNYLAYFLIFFGAVLRLIPHPANFAPISALALFGGVYLNKRAALLLPLLAMVLSDFFIGFDSLMSRAVVYGSFLSVVFIGLLVRKRKNFATILGGVLLGSVIFYLVTNFALFYPAGMYPHNWNGIVSSYINALPFFRNSLMGDLFYTGVFFGAYEAVLARYRRKQISANKSAIPQNY